MKLFRRGRHEPGVDIPIFPVYKDERLWYRFTTAGSIRLLIIAQLLVLGVFSAELITLHAQVHRNTQTQQTQHAQRLADDAAIRAAILAGEKAIKAEFDEQLRSIAASETAGLEHAVCTFLAQYPRDITPGFKALRLQYHCTIALHPAALGGAHAAPPAASSNVAPPAVTVPGPAGPTVTRTATQTRTVPVPTPIPSGLLSGILGSLCVVIPRLC